MTTRLLMSDGSHFTVDEDEEQALRLLQVPQTRLVKFTRPEGTALYVNAMEVTAIEVRGAPVEEGVVLSGKYAGL